MMTKQLLKMYGERNTGTNYLSKLIDLNLQIEQLPGVLPQWLLNAQEKFPAKEFVRDAYFSMTFHRNLGWKHALVKSAKELRQYPVYSKNLSFVTVSKNPYSWLLSLYRKPYHQNYTRKPDFETFLSAPWQGVRRDNVSGKISSPVNLWNMKNSSYMQLSNELSVLNLTFEKLLADPAQVLKSISDFTSCEWKHEQFRNYDKSTKESSKDSNFYKDYYLNEKWKLDYSPRAIEIVNERLNREVMDYFHYREWLGS